MLSRKQLEEAAAYQDCTAERQELAKTAIVLLNMLLEVKNCVDYCPICGKDIGHETNCELEKILKDMQIGGVKAE